jgi:hypothetical protein
MKTSRWLLGAAIFCGTAAAAGQATDPHAGNAQLVELRFPTWDGKQETSRFSIVDANAPLRSYVQSTSMRLRDGAPQTVRYRESDALPRVRSGSVAFDALFALAGSEMLQDSVHEIRDDSYNGGAPIPCECFETGEKWHYVWTRDLSYAADLGLALLDPRRVRNSLLFKLSGWRAGVAKPAHVAGGDDGLQIVQDTGSGGSWPVSTDRIAWAYAAEDVLHTLPVPERAAFATTALKALSNTIENDRVAAFDPATGLYNGEESFLDWREQTYAAWMPANLSYMATSKALSTNVGHYKALSVAAQLAREAGDGARSARYAQWAAALKAAINLQLWQNVEGMYSSVTAGHFDGAALNKFDWLGQALAIDTGIADFARARSILAHYPHGPMGAPVIWPQQHGVPVYHNRAIWPFVTAYGLRAASRVRNVSVADAAYDTLMRGAALNLSNMENLEWLTGQPMLDDPKHPELSGPVISSRRQLWSVGAYLGMVIENVFGVRPGAAGIALKPFVTAKLRREALGGSDDAVLENLRLRGKRIAIHLHLPAAAGGDGYYTVTAVRLNGSSSKKTIGWHELRDDNRIDIELGALKPGDSAIRRVNANPYEESPAVFGPYEPAIRRIALEDKHAVLDVEGTGDDAPLTVYRDGWPVAVNVVPGTWTDTGDHPVSCYAVAASYRGSENSSHHSLPQCVGPAVDIPVTDARVRSSVALTQASELIPLAHIGNWGEPDDSFSVNAIRVDQPGRYAVQVRYHNGANQVNLGISGGVKWMTVQDEAGHVVAQGVVQLPHSPSAARGSPAVYSTPLYAKLDAGASYRVQLGDFYNMSYLQSNSTFSAAGGADGPSNRFDIYGVRLLRLR